MPSSKKLILNADDYGASPAVNAAVEALVARELLGGVSVLANGSSGADAIRYLQSAPPVGIGIHFNLVDGPPLSKSADIHGLLGADGNFAGRQRVFRQWLARPAQTARAVETEWRTQLERLLAAGLRLSHADSHQHLHAFPPAFRLAVQLCRQYQIPALRIPAERNRLSQRTLSNLALRTSLAVSQRNLPVAPLRHNQHFLGFKRAGGYGLPALLTDLRTLPPGLTELALHPSLTNHHPYRTLRGHDEFLALTSQAFRDLIEEQNIQLLRWDQI